VPAPGHACHRRVIAVGTELEQLTMGWIVTWHRPGDIATAPPLAAARPRDSPRGL
jgi:hypothetical protein